MANKINLNTSPYYDDFDEDKKFLKVLFRPGYSVQARELTQAQTILQNQIDRFGRHMFKEGAMIIPGEISYDIKHYYAKIYDLSAGLIGTTVVKEWFVGATIACTTTGVEAKVTDFVQSDEETGDPKTLYVQYSRGGSIGGVPVTTFRPDDVITVISNPTIPEYEGMTAVIKSETDSVGTGSAAYINDGIYFTQGYFVKVDKQKIFLNKYSATDLSYRVGLYADQEIITEREDSTLNSNASGEPNYSAPGAHRFRISLILAKLDLQPEEEPRQPPMVLDDSPSWIKNFIELLVVKNDKVYKKVIYTDYNIIEQTMARRTYDESGDYTVRPFLIALRDYLDDGTNNGILKRSLILDFGINTYEIQEGDKITNSTDSQIFGIVTLYNPKTGRAFYILNDNDYKFTSGDTVNIFHLNGTTLEANGQATITEIFGNDYDQKMGIVIEPGKAYVKGHEIERIANEVLSTDRERRFRRQKNVRMTFPHGNAVYIKNMQGSIPKIHQFEKVDLYDVTNLEVSASIVPVTIAGTSSASPAKFTRTDAGTWTTDQVLNQYAWVYKLSDGRYSTTGTWRQITSHTPTVLTLSLPGDALPTGADTIEIFDAPYVIQPPRKIGTCRIKFIQYDQGDISLSSDQNDSNSYGKLFLHIFDVNMIEHENFEHVQSFYHETGFKCDVITDLYQMQGKVTTDPTQGTTLTDPDQEFQLQGDQDAVFNNQLKVNDIIFLRPGEPDKRLKILVTDVISDYVLKYKILNQAEPATLPGFINEPYFVQFAALDAPANNSLIYRFPHTNIKTLDNTKTQFSTSRVLENNPLNPTTEKPPYNYYASIGPYSSPIEYLSNDSDDYIVFNQTTGKFIKTEDFNVDGVPYIIPEEIGRFSQVRLYIADAALSDDPVNDIIDCIFVVFKSSTASQFKSKQLAGYSEDIEDLEILKQNTIKLSNIDVYQIESILMSATNGTFVEAGSVDITDRYGLDDGQTNNYYDYSKLVRKNSGSIPTGTLRVTYKYYQRTTPNIRDAYYCVDSYQEYDKIPYFISSDGTIYNLSDCIDFRPDVTELDDTNSHIELHVPIWGVITEYDHYLHRKDKLVLKETGQFEIIQGTPDVEPSDPETPADSMLLYRLFIPAYTAKSSDIEIQFVENKRYTMRDIGKLETRISNLEYYTTLSLLEKETADMRISDPETGLDRFQLGFIVDPFSSPFNEFSVGDTALLNFELKCSIDPKASQCRPQFIARQCPLKLNGSNQVNIDSDVLSKDGVAMLPIESEVVLVSQEIATYFENVNPYNIPSFVGIVKLNPPFDQWKETKYIKDDRIDVMGNYDAITQMAKDTGTVWNDWKTTWSGWSDPKKSDDTSKQQIGWDLGGKGEVYYSQLHFDNNGNPLPLNKLPAKDRKKIEELREQVKATHPKRRIIEKRYTDTRTGSLTTHKTGVNLSTREVIQETKVGEKVISVDYIPFIRSRLISFVADRLAPNTIVWPFFDNKPVKDYCSMSTIQNTVTGELGINTATQSLISDNTGHLTGYFEIPNNDTIKFNTGKRSFRLTSSKDNKPGSGEYPTYCDASYTAEGLTETKQNTIMAVHNAEIIRTPVEDDTNVTIDSIDTYTRTIKGDWIDPIAQTFLVDSVGGAFLTSVDIYFKKKSDTESIELQIREVTGDQRPSPDKCLPFSRTVLQSSEVNISSNASVKTTFRFSTPIYVMDKTVYALCLISDRSDSYEVWTANLESPMPETPDSEIKNVIVSPSSLAGKIYTQGSFTQYSGIFFRSQNGGTWSDAQLVDLKFTINKAKFNISNPGSFEMVNTMEELPSAYWQTLSANSVKIKSGSNKLRIYHPCHGFKQGDIVSLYFSNDVELYIQDLPVTDWIHINEIPGIIQNRPVLQAETDYYVIGTDDNAQIWSITAGLAGTTYSGTIDAAVIKGTYCKKYDVIEPTIGELNFGALTSTRYEIEGTRSDGSYISDSITANENLEFDSSTGSMIVYDPANFPEPSLLIRSYLTSSNENVSPVIWTKKFAATLIDSRVDNPTENWNYSGIDDILIDASLTADFGNEGLVGWFTINSLSEDRANQLYDILYSGKIISIDTDKRMILKRVLTLNGSSSTLKIYISYTSNQWLTPCDAGTNIISLTLHDHYIDEIAPLGGSAAAKYVTRRMALKNSATSLQILFAGECDQLSEFRTYYKVQEQGDSRSMDEIEYTLAEPINVPSKTVASGQVSEYRYLITNMKPYVAVVAKIVMIALSDGASSSPPKILDFRMIALE